MADNWRSLRSGFMTTAARVDGPLAASPGKRSAVAGSDVVRVILALILLAAAALNAYQLAAEPTAEKNIFTYRWSLMPQVQCEILFGL